MKVQRQESSTGSSNFRNGMPGGMNFEGMPNMPSGSGMPNIPSSGSMPNFSGSERPNMR